MVKLTTFLLATVAIFAVSTQAQVSTTPASIFADVSSTPIEDVHILPYEPSLVKRAPAPTKPKPKPVKLTKEMQSILDTHNRARARHGARPLKWNVNAAAFGNKWIQACQFKHSGGPYGENLAAGYKDFKAAISGWYSEEKKYNYKRPGFSMGTGHFTQVVWKDTTSVGCAKKYCANSKWTIYICNYERAGNIVSGDNGYFKKNVLPPRK